MIFIVQNCPSAISFMLTDAVDGEWGDWESWGDCSATCGGGTQSRSRECNNPPAANGGAECPADDLSSETQNCNPEACPEQPGQYK